MSAAPRPPFDPSDELDWPFVGELVDALREIVAANQLVADSETPDDHDRLASAVAAGANLLARIDRMSKEVF